MKELGYGENYRYAHDFEGHFAEQEFMPEGLEGRRFYTPDDNPEERADRRADPHVVERKILITKAAFRTCGQKPARDDRPRRRIAGKRLRDFRMAG